MSQPQPKTIPAKACQFAAEMQLGAGGESGNVPITLVARSGEAIDNWWWGRIVHDFSGMTIPKPSIPLDYCHYDDEVLGYANQFATDTGSLVAKGELVPYPDKTDDRAKEVIFRAGKGVPYEASIFFDGPMSIEEVGEGAVAQVNGKQFTGPLTVVRQWTLRGIAVCPYGSDPNTSAAMKFGRNGDIKATVIQKGSKMSTATTSAEGATAAVETSQTENKSADAATEKPEDAGTETQKTETAEANDGATDSKPADAATQLTDGQRFLKEFGPQGGVWFAEGKTFAEAQKLHTASLADANKKLSKENEDLRKQLGANRGEEDPVSFSGGQPEQKKVSNLPDGLSKFAGSIKIPGRTAASNN